MCENQARRGRELQRRDKELTFHESEIASLSSCSGDTKGGRAASGPTEGLKFRTRLAAKPTTKAGAVACVEHVAECGLATDEMRAWLAMLLNCHDLRCLRDLRAAFSGRLSLFGGAASIPPPPDGVLRLARQSSNSISDGRGGSNACSGIRGRPRRIRGWSMRLLATWTLTV